MIYIKAKIKHLPSTKVNIGSLCAENVSKIYDYLPNFNIKGTIDDNEKKWNPKDWG